MALLGDLQQHWASVLEGYSVLPGLGAQFGGISGGSSTHSSRREQPLLGVAGQCPDCGGERDSIRTHLLACRGGAGTGGGNWYSFIHHKLQRVLFEVAKTAFLLASVTR